ncbi:MAG: hypothetical protein P1Q69_03500 [Candidatus Thorarchaeota archaeon]|nr:hypothetical protein [Candidatus Thorarchaeota archaeon]
MIIIFQGEPVITVSLYFVIPFILLALILVYYGIRKVLRARRDKIDGPFEHTEGRTTLFQLTARLPRTRVLAVIVLVIIAVPSIVIVGQQPVHRTEIEHTDPEGDVTDPDIDIIQIKSYLNGTDLFLELTVAGSIVETSGEIGYLYRLEIITKGLAADIGIVTYRVTFENGTVTGYSTYGYVKENTLTIVVSIYTLRDVSYMVGLEGKAQSYFEADETLPDRNGTVAHLWF